MVEQRQETATATAAEGAQSEVVGAAEAVYGPQAAQRGAKGSADGLEPAEEAEPLTDVQRCEISLLRNIYYHEDRAAHFARINRGMDLLILVAGLATVVALSDLLPGWLQVDGRWIAAAVSVAGAVNLVFRLGSLEHLHAYLRRRFLEIHADLQGGADLKSVAQKMRALYPEEPPTYHAVDAIAFNAAMRALRRPEKHLLDVSGLARVLRHCSRRSPNDFKPKG